MNFVIRSMDIVYEGKNYPCLVSIKQQKSRSVYSVTIMQGELEAQFFPYRAFHERDGVIEPTAIAERESIRELQLVVAKRIDEMLLQPALVDK